jgi:hypothetical protein
MIVQQVQARRRRPDPLDHLEIQRANFGQVMKLFLAVLVTLSIFLVEVPVNANNPVTSSGPSHGTSELQVLD